MATIEVETSRTFYYPGESVVATLTLRSNGSGSVSARQSRFTASKSGSGRHLSRANKPEAGTTKAISIDTELDSILPSTRPLMTRTPTGPDSPHAEVKSAKGHKKSVSFSPMVSPTSPRHARTLSSELLHGNSDASETLLIVYAQFVGSFHLDQTYMANQPFDSIRGQGLNGASAGGLVSNSSMTSSRWSFGSWSSVLAGAQPSSLAEIRQAAATKNLPILSMPPTIVDIQVRLEPDVEIEKVFSFTLPEDLPPTYVGKSMCISYALKLSAQRQDKSITTFECPVQINTRISQSVYDFTRPHLLTSSTATLRSSSEQPPRQSKSVSTKEDFLDFLTALEVPNGDLPSPVEEHKAVFPHITSEYNLHRSHGLRFDVTRGKAEHVCKVTLEKSSYEAGEVITGVLDFAEAQLDCFRCVVSLESAELVDPDFAVLTPEKLAEATAAALGRHEVICAFALQSSFEIGIPADCTNTFRTIPLELKYTLHFEFLLHERDQMMIETRTKHGIEAAPVENVVGELFECSIPFTLVSPSQPSTITYIKSGVL